jgi:DNA-directed RNA polymerase subunit RPC12/RpoP
MADMYYKCSDCGAAIRLNETERNNRIKRNVPFDKCSSCVRRYTKEEKICVKCGKPFILTFFGKQKRNQKKMPLDKCTSCIMVEKYGVTNISKLDHIKDKK